MKGKMTEKYGEFQKFVVESVKEIKSNMEALFVKVQEQLELKAGSTDQLLSALEQMKNKELQYTRFVSLMQKLLAGVPLDP